MEGQIIKGIAGFYYVKSGETVYRCKARGIFKQQEIRPAVGDLVSIQVIEGNDDSLITEIHPRKNCCVRPFVGNVDCIVIVAAALRPAPVLSVIDRLLVTAEQADTDSIICVSKCDLASGPGKGTARKAAENIERIRDNYASIYPVVCLDAMSGSGLQTLREMIRGRTIALAGASGVGKSTLLNLLTGREKMETGSVSRKSQRGRHTTRHAELFETDSFGTRVFDTPGFTSFALPELEAEELQHMLPEFVPYIGKCRYDDCRHIAEPECAVRAAAEDGRIHPERYASYQEMLREIEERKKY